MRKSKIIQITTRRIYFYQLGISHPSLRAGSFTKKPGKASGAASVFSLTIASFFNVITSIIPRCAVGIT